MSLERYTESVREIVGENSGLNATIKFVLDDKILFIDGKSHPNVVDNQDREADCTLRISLEDFANLINRSLDPTTAFMVGKLTVDGDMSIAMRLGRLLSG